MNRIQIYGMPMLKTYLYTLHLIIHNPEILIADEPTGSLDIKSSKEVMEIFSKINTEGTTVVMVTHEQDTLKYSKKVYTMIDGELFSGNKLTV